MFGLLRSPLTVAVVSATVLIATVRSAEASSSHTTELSSPVIHESFTVLPCSGAAGHRSTLEQTGCAEHRILQTDTKIDMLNESIFTKVEDDRARLRFIAAHKAWLSYRHAYCLSRSDVFQGGTEAGVIDAECDVALNTRHIKDLTEFDSDLSSG